MITSSLLNLFYLNHTYINYANIAWGSIHFTNLKKNIIVSKNMQYTLYLIMIKSNIQLFRQNKILNLYHFIY